MRPSFIAACLAIFSHVLHADPVFDPAKTIIIKADDYSGNYNNQQQRWTDFVTSSRNLGIKVSLGVVPAHVPAGNDAALWMQQQQALGDVEYWNHGWDHSRDPADPPSYWEFRNTPLADQQEHFADAQAWLLAATGRAPVAFGAPYNQTDANTMTVMNATPAIRLFFTYNGGTARTQGLLKRVHTIGIIAESGGTGKPVADTFISTYPNGPAGPVSLQFHPAAFTATDLAEYVEIVGFLQTKGYSFMLPEEYVAAAVPEGAKVWTGATDANWTTNANWSAAGAPAVGEDVAFDGSGANLGTQLNGTARSLNSLTFTTGQSAQVTVTTTNAAQLSLGPASGTGPFTVLNVAAGSHRFAGTNGGTGTTADLRFLGTTGTTFILNVAGPAVFDLNARIVNSGGTASNRTFRKTGTGTLVLSGDSGGSGAWQHSTGGGFQIQQGALRFAALNAGGNSANNYSVSSGAALELDGDFNQTINNGTYTLNGSGIAGSGALRSLGGTKSVAGSGTGGINLATDAGIGVDAGNLTIAQVVKGPGALTKVGAGTLTLTGANNHSGATIVSAGTLALGASNVLPATPVSVGAATLAIAAGVTEATGRLDVTGAATLHLGDSSSAIAFDDNGDLLDWAGALDITGAFVPGVSVRFGTDGSGLTAAQLAKITVNGVGSFTLNASGHLAEPVAVTPYTYVDATPANTTLNGAPLVDRNANPTTGNYHNESTGSAGTGTDGRWAYRTSSAFASFEGAACFESDSANVSGDAENTPPLVTTITPGAPGTYDIVVLFSRNSNRDIAAKTGSAPATSDIFTTANAFNADQNLTPEPQIVFDASYSNSRGTNSGAAYLGQVTTTTAGQSVTIYVNGFDSLAGTQDERTQYEGVGYRPAPPATQKHYDVYLIAGQSNADGRGTNSDLTGALAAYAGPQPGVKLYYVNPINSDPVNPTYNTGWTTLAPGYAVAPGFSGALPSARFGFEVSLGKALAAKDPERNVAIIKVTRGGTNLHTQWDPAGGDNFMWQTFANQVPQALAALTANGDTAGIQGMFWHQGESDGGNPTFQSDLAGFIAACRTLAGKPDLPFAIGELERDDVTPTVSGRNYQLTAMANVAAADPNAFVVSSAGLLTYDGTHFTSGAYITFGERFAQAYFDFLDGLDFTVTYDGNESTGGSPPVDSRIYNSIATATVLAPGTLAKDGHTFAGWNTQANGTGTAYAADNIFVITETTTLHAQWTALPTPFGIWAGDVGITFPGDANGDGIADGMAWLLGSASPGVNANALLPTATENEGALQISFTMRNQAARGSAVLNLQHGITLSSWTTIPVPDVTPANPVDGVTFTVTPDGDLNHVVATLPTTAAPDGRLFVRLSGTQN
jgi:autotransporter-associated beta strand protein